MLTKVGTKFYPESWGDDLYVGQSL